MANERRINTVLGGVARTVGADGQDINTLERRRLEHERRTQAAPKRPFGDLLAEQQPSPTEPPTAGQSAEAAAATATKGASAKLQTPSAKQAARPAGPVLPKGRGRLIRG